MNRFALILFGFLSTVSSLSYAHGPDEGYSMGPWMMWGHGAGWFWPIFMIIIPITIIVGIIFLIRWLIISSDGAKKTGKEISALDILKRRYAQGEIDKDEFKQKKKDLAE
jgi:putative membrane protein